MYFIRTTLFVAATGYQIRFTPKQSRLWVLGDELQSIFTYKQEMITTVRFAISPVMASVGYVQNADVDKLKRILKLFNRRTVTQHVHPKHEPCRRIFRVRLDLNRK